MKHLTAWALLAACTAIQWPIHGLSLREVAAGLYFSALALVAHKILELGHKATK